MSSSAESGSGGPWRSSSSWAKESRPAARSESLSVDETYLLDCVRDGIERAIERAMRCVAGGAEGAGSQGGEAESVNGRQSDPSSSSSSSQAKSSQVRSSQAPCAGRMRMSFQRPGIFYPCASLATCAHVSLNATSMASTTGSGGQGGAPNMCSKAVKRGSELSHQYMRCESGDPEGSKR